VVVIFRKRVVFADNVVDPQDVQSFRLAQRKTHAGARIEAELVVAVVEVDDEAEL
jgi:hypothetical protein